jgi:hypothetical protein
MSISCCLTLRGQSTASRTTSNDLIRHFFAPFASNREQAVNLFRYLVHNDGSHTIALEPDLPH